MEEQDNKIEQATQLALSYTGSRIPYMEAAGDVRYALHSNQGLVSPPLPSLILFIRCLATSLNWLINLQRLI